MNLFKRLFSVLALTALAACGGGGGASGGNPFPPPGTTPPPPTAANVADLDVSLASSTIPNTGASTVTVTVTALDSNRVAVAGAAVNLSANANALLTVLGTIGSVTDANGRLQATVGIGSDRTNRDITITASAGTISRSAILRVVNSTTGNPPTSIEVIAASPTAGTGGDSVQIRAFVKDSNNNALAAAPVTFGTTSGTLSAASTVTDASGLAIATFSSGADRSNRTARITVSSGTISTTLDLPVTGTRLSLSGPSSLIIGATTTFNIVVTDSRGNVVPNVSITATSSLANPITAQGGNVTNSSGQVSFAYTATNSGTDNLVFSGAGTSISPSPALVVSGDDFTFTSPAPSSTVPVDTSQVLTVRLRSGGVPQAGRTILFASTGGTLSASTAVTSGAGLATVSLTSPSAGPVTVQATVQGTSSSTSLPLQIVATVPAQLVLQVSPTAIAPNTGTSTANQAQVTAKVTDARGNPVQGQSVNFTRVTDPSGGNLLQATATTDAGGQATVTYRAGTQSTANNGIILEASVASAPTVVGRATLTVNQTALFIALGTGNTVSNVDPQTYRKDWVVYVTDSNSIPVNGVTLTIKNIPRYYLTGELKWNGTRWDYVAPIYACRNEDANANGILDSGEDDNGDQVLWPGNVVGVAPGNVQTTEGRATISLTYAESYVPWIIVRLTASATVSGTESRTDAEFTIEGSAPDFTNESIPPAGVTSPFGAMPRFPNLCTLLPLPR